MKFSNSGIPGLSPFLFLTASTNNPDLDVASYGSDGKISQWSNTHCGNALPDVISLRCYVKPNDSATGKYDLTMIRGVPFTGSSPITIPLLWVKVV